MSQKMSLKYNMAQYDMYKVIQYSSRKLQEPSLNGTTAVPTSEDCKAIMLILLMTGTYK
jgi:hypothetical protein